MENLRWLYMAHELLVDSGVIKGARPKKFHYKANNLEIRFQQRCRARLMQKDDLVESDESVADACRRVVQIQEEHLDRYELDHDYVYDVWLNKELPKGRKLLTVNLSRRIVRSNAALTTKDSLTLDTLLFAHGDKCQYGVYLGHNFAAWDRDSHHYGRPKMRFADEKIDAMTPEQAVHSWVQDLQRYLR